MDGYLEQTIIHWDGTAGRRDHRNIIAEEPLSIRIQGKPYSVIMRTPGDEIAHVAGFCLAEGIVDSPGDFSAIGFCDGTDTNVVTVTLTASRREKIAATLDRRGFISQTSCGICGKEIIKDLQQAISTLPDGPSLSAYRIMTCVATLSGHQPLRRQTLASHAAALFTSDFELLAVAEDVGRHNALDKVIGKLFLTGRLAEACLLVLSSRTSYELVQKAGRAGIPIVLSVSRPTAIAVALAEQLNMTLACLAHDTGLYIFCGADRLVF
ncbi:MAG: formate dehydrogenase accessory sulfurtransferase FdhD [Deltaproteobacteria bacterium]|nr:formate dehydrogenase accessory sulfurtransferase FdhD [Deltaproteobacteria bacterium]